jgi:murein DD-endopeptidase MepM/ murein hydrolase activator NlpD
VWDRPADIKRPDAATRPVEPAPAPSVTVPAEAPVSRRSRRALAGEQRVVAEPSIAPVAPAEPERPAAAFAAELPTHAEPAPLLDTVLAPAEPFELLEPAAEEAPTTATAVAEPSPAGSSTSSGTPSSWAAESFAKLLVAEAAATAATTAPRVATTPSPAPVAQAAEAAPESAPTATPPAADQPAAVRGSRPRAERPRTERIEPLTGPIPAPPASGIDEFEAAARLFSFTAETPVQEAAADATGESASESEPAAEAEPAAHTAPRRSAARRGSAFKRAATASFSVGVFGIVGLMAVGMTTPAEAVAAVSGVDASLSVVASGDTSLPVIDEDEIQAYVAPVDAQSDTLQRTETYSTTTTAQLASEAGIRNFSNLFHNNPNSNVQWPFAVGVTMSYGFGMRSGRMHEGIDFTPGAGAPVQAIADGTVRVASEAGGAYGVHVIIDHIVDGELVSSHYAHMQYGSLQVTAGQHVTVGTMLGRTGNTGRSYGAHTHFEILKNGTTAIDPMPWLRTYTDGTHTVG